MNPNSLPQLTLGQLCKRVGLARTSVINYEALGLLTARGRSEAGYRFYGDVELARLQNIRRFRDAGLSLPDIRTLLDSASAHASGASGSKKGRIDAKALLEKRLMDLSQEVERIHDQQRLLARLLAMPDRDEGEQKAWDKAAWVALLQRAGFDEAAMQRWHAEFERESPQNHASFLKSLGIKPAEASAIRGQSTLNTKAR